MVILSASRRNIQKARKISQLFIAIHKSPFHINHFSTISRQNAPESNDSNNSINSLKGGKLKPSFKNNFILISGDFVSRINSIKREWSNKGETPDPQFLNNLKNLIKFIASESSNYEKFIKILDRINPIIQSTLKQLDTKAFIDWLIFLSFYGLTVGKNTIAAQTSKLEKLPKLALKNLVFCDQNMKGDLFTPLTFDQKNRMSITYPPDLIEWIVCKVYLPLASEKKVDEFIEILYLQKNDQTTKRFERAINVFLSKDRLVVPSWPNMRISSINNQLRMNYRLPEDMMVKLFEKYVHTLYQGSNFQNMIRFVDSMFLPLPSQLKTFGKIAKHESMIGDVIDKEYHVTTSVLCFLFGKYLRESNLEQIKELFCEVESLDDTNEMNMKIKSCFKITCLKYASEIRDRKNDIASYIVHQYMNTMDDFPGDEFPLLDYFNCCKNDIYGFFKLLDAHGNFDSGYKKIKTAELEFILQSLNENQKSKLLKTLIRWDYTFESRDLILSWIAEEPHRANYVLFGGSIDPSEKYFVKSKMYLTGGFHILSPTEMLSLTAKYGDKVLGLNEILNILSPYKDTNFDYLISKIYSLKLQDGTEQHFKSLAEFLHQNEKLVSTLTEKEMKLVLDTFIMKTLEVNVYLGVVFACYLIPSYKNTLVSLFQFVITSIADTSEIDPFIYKGDGEIPLNVMKRMVKGLEAQKFHGGYLCGQFKKLIEYSTSIQDLTDRNDFQKFVFEVCQGIAIKKKMSPYILYNIYSVAESFNLNPEWKLEFDLERYIEKYILSSSILSGELKMIIQTVSTLENDLSFSKNFYRKVFNDIPEDAKMGMLFLLRNISSRVPFVGEIAQFITEKVEANDSNIYKLFGLQIDNLSADASLSWQVKWSKMDVRYLTPFIAKRMGTLIDKEANLAFRYVMSDSLASMPYNKEDFDACNKFYSTFVKCTHFEANPETHNLVTVEQVMEEYKSNFSGIKDVPNELVNPYMFHFLFTRFHKYNVKTSVELLYIFTKRDQLLEQFGFWELLTDEDKLRLRSIVYTGNRLYSEKTDEQLRNLFILISATCKVDEKVSNQELLYVVKIAETLTESEFVSTDSKKQILNCVFLIVNKHSDIVTAFFRKILNKYPDYKVSFPIAKELLYSTILWDSKHLDIMMDYLNDKYTPKFGNQVYEVVVKRLVDEEQTVLAQELYKKCCEQRPKFTIPEVNEKLNWSVARKPAVVIDSNEGVNLKMDRFKVKLYDYDNLDKDKK